MSEKTYLVKQLEWDGKPPDEDGWQMLSAHTPFGSYTITVSEDSSIRWSYCFDEYYDEGDFQADNIESAKAAAFAHWCDRLSGCLSDVPSGKKAGNSCYPRESEK